MCVIDTIWFCLKRYLFCWIIILCFSFFYVFFIVYLKKCNKVNVLIFFLHYLTFNILYINQSGVRQWPRNTFFKALYLCIWYHVCLYICPFDFSHTIQLRFFKFWHMTPNVTIWIIYIFFAELMPFFYFSLIGHNSFKLNLEFTRFLVCCWGDLILLKSV